MSGFLKTHANNATAAEAMRRASVLRSSGIPTPNAWPGHTPREVMFDRLDGETGLTLARTDILQLLRPLTELHACQVPGLSPYDPFLRIRPRLALATSDPVRAVLNGPVPQGGATLHGDLHVGQFIRDHFGKVWIIDLDDLALGPPEADLANFTAHLATSQPGGVTCWANRVQEAWQALGQVCDRDCFECFLRIALVRRHLKLREAGRPDFEDVVTSYLRDSSNFSIL